MIRATIVVEPHGDVSRSKRLGEICVANVTRGGGRVSSDYAWRIKYLGRNDIEVVKYGCLVDSCNANAVDLLAEVLMEWKSGRDMPIDNHGFAVRVIDHLPEFWAAVDKKG